MKRIVFSENEYMSIRAEMIERIRLLNSQSFTALATVISFWTAGFTFKMALISKYDFISTEWERITMDFLSATIFLIPIFLFIPLSVKSGENLAQIASISAYIRVFYDFSILKSKINRNWETSNNLLSNSNVDRKRKGDFLVFYNGEYTTLAVISFALYVICALLNIKKIIILFDTGKINVICTHCIIIVYFVITIIIPFIIIIIHKVACMKNSLMDKTVYYVQGYIKRANELGIIRDEDMQIAINELNPKKELHVENYF